MKRLCKQLRESNGGTKAWGVALEINVLEVFATRKHCHPV